MVTQGNAITKVDIDAIITLINGEENNRVMGLSDLANVSVGDYVDDQKFTDMIDRNDSINAHHCYCEGEQDGGDGGTTLTLTASLGDHDPGDEYTATNINEIDTDIDSLIAQCDCNDYECTCVSNCETVCECNELCTCVSQGCSCDADVCTCVSQGCGCNADVCTCVSQGCGCNTNVCTCVGYCNECSCNAYTCPCQGVCTCEHWFDMCGDDWWVCLVDDGPCSCQGYTCGCQSDCGQCLCNKLCTCVSQGCGCNANVCTCVSQGCSCDADVCTCVSQGCSCNTDVCTCVDDCVSECTCNLHCQCEYN